MNLGFLMYLADVAGELDSIFFSLALLLSLITMILAVVIGGIFDDASPEEGGARLQKISRLWIKFAVASLCFAVLCIITPSKKTVYLMAASSVTAEIAEQAKSTPEFEKLRKILNDSLDSYIPEKKEKE
jgi:hypothetical protein